MLRIALLLALPAFVARADRRQATTHEMRWTDRTTIHMAGDSGAINRHGKATISVEMRSNGRVTVTDTGERRRHDLYDGYSTGEITAWTTIWDGTWKLAGPTLTLALSRRSHRCKREKTWSDAPPEAKPCAPADAKVTLACTLERVELTSWAGAGKTVKTVDAWRCAPSSGKLGETLPQWTLGRAGCIRVTAGMPDPETFAPC